MLAAIWKKEKWLKVERIMGAQSVSAQETTHTHVGEQSTTTAQHHTHTHTQMVALTGGRVRREVSDHGALKGRDTPAAEHHSVGSNDPWGKRDYTVHRAVPPRDSAPLGGPRRHSESTNFRTMHPNRTNRVGVCVCVCLTCDCPLTFTQAVPPLVDLKQPIRAQTVTSSPPFCPSEHGTSSFRLV